MADKKLNQIATSSNADYIIGTMSNGQEVRISKADLASVVGGLIGIATTTKDGLMNKASVPTKINISSTENTNRSRISMSIGSTLLFSVKTNGNSGCLFYIVCNDGGKKYVYKITGLSTNISTFYYDANYLYVQTKYGSSNAVLPLHPTTPIIQERITTIPSDATLITVE